MWFSRFIEGCKRRMGQASRPNRGIRTDLIKATLGMCLSLSDEALVPTHKQLWVELGSKGSSPGFHGVGTSWQSERRDSFAGPLVAVRSHHIVWDQS
jgi:hypothetical protein